MSEAVKSSSAPGSEVQAFGSPAARRLSPNKLLLSKWTAASPHNKEKHFIVTGVIQPEPPATRIESIELEAVYSRRVFSLSWRDLTEGQRWLQGWQ
ncbi:TIGR02450 family Trp-rich protein [Accumulibacter sp.]|uniref:TIGR02450 family Trp-rich protein n=1 Tax=Accumulibacter sp. TaxID=2053492 RepID=UPI0028C3AC75|nr:TIGR02450 family Trp-rich protein [Accumulibacter sp.]